jgi:hypothetical protein
MPTVRYSRARIIPICLGLLAGCRAAEPPLVRIVSRDFEFDAPDTIPAGLVRVRLVNQGPDIHEAMMVHFISAAGSAAGYADSVRADVDFPAFAEDMGGSGLSGPGDSNDVYIELEPGRYALVCWKGDHLRRGMVRDLVVVPRDGAATVPPSADVTITMLEYGYQLSGPLAAGRHLVKVENRGNQPHEADIVRLGPGKTASDYIAWLDAGEPGLPPSEPVSGVGDFIAGRSVWMAVDLVPGRYLIICQVPDANGGVSHHKLGMVREFVVDSIPHQ